MAESKAQAESKAEKMVKIRIPRTRTETEDVFVSVNMRNFLIKRGVEVEVPESVAEVLSHQEEALDEAYEFSESVQSNDA